MKLIWKDIRPSVVIVGIVIVAAVAFFLNEALFSSTAVNQLTTVIEEVPQAELPARLVIPSIGVDAPVQLVGLATSSVDQMAVPTNFTDVGWYKFGPRPGMPGSAVVAGHLNGKDVPEAVFYDLNAVQIDDEVRIIDVTGAILTFRVVDVRTYTHDSPTEEVFVSTDGIVRLNLITCAGDWLSSEALYNQRTVVFTELVSTIE